MIPIINVDNALIDGFTLFDIVYTRMEMLLTPLPVTKYEMIKSSKLIVNATSAPEIIPGIICGTITLVSACHGVAPKSSAASARLGSNDRSFGITLSITYGIQNITCAKSIVVKPFFTPSILKNINNPIAVTMSGLLIGRLFTCSIVPRTSLRQLESPIAAMVPTTVEITVARSAITMV